MLVVYMAAMAVNAMVVLTCRCSAGHDHSAHEACGVECTVDAGTLCFTQHCECTHSHENRFAYALTADGERAMKFMRAAVAQLPKPMIEIPGEADAMPVEKVYCEWKTPLADAPLISSGALRAPPVAA